MNADHLIAACLRLPVCIFCCLLVACQSQPLGEKGPLTEAEKRLPNHAISQLEVAEGLSLGLFAAEPMLVNPTNMDIDLQGRVWVCEAFNYRNQLNPGNPYRTEGDRIVVLEDTDQDGLADKSTVFYQGEDINSALGIMVLGNRVYISCSPNVLILTDEDGDSRADKKEILFTGIGGEQHDHAAHAFVFGPDGKLYFNMGNEGRQLLDAEGAPVIDQAGNRVRAEGKPYREGMVFRCDLDGSKMEVLGHNFRNNYEVAVDAFGTLWQSDNDDDGNEAVRINYVMEYGNFGYKDQHTGAGWRTRRTGMADHIPHRHWHLNDPGVVPNLLQTGAGSPTGILVYEGDLLPEPFRNQLIHADAGPNVVRAYQIEPQGAGYEARIQNLVKGVSDPWFRPSDVCVAPDGSLFIADWYDPGVGGHQMGDTARGRIYRLAPTGAAYQITPPDLNSLSGAIEALKSPNLSLRAQAWLKLHEAGDKAEKVLAALWQSENPRFRARALWLLSKMPEQGEQYLEQALADDDPNLRITGLRAARQLDLDMMPYLTQLAEDPHPQVRREVAIALRFLPNREADQLWAKLALQYQDQDRWYLEALGIGSDLYADQRFNAWRVAGKKMPDSLRNDIIWRSKSVRSVRELGKLIKNSPDAMAAYRYFRALDFQDNPRKHVVLLNLLNGKHPAQSTINYLVLYHLDPAQLRESSRARKVLQQLLSEYKGTVAYLNLVEKMDLRTEVLALADLAMAHPNDPLGIRAAQLLGDWNQYEWFEQIRDQGTEAELIVAMRALSRKPNTEALDYLEALALDAARPMSIRREAIQYLGTGWHGETRLVELLQKQKNLPEALQQAGAVRLLGVYRESYRKLAAEMLKLTDEALPPMADLVVMEGNAESGMDIFKRQCSACHVVNGSGVDFGPNLSGIGSKLSREGLLSAILYPNAGISFGYEGYLISTHDGNKYLGYIASETEDQLELRMSGGVTQKILKANLKDRVLQKNSLMTPGLHTLMQQQELIDLVHYLESLKGEDAPMTSR